MAPTSRSIEDARVVLPKGEYKLSGENGGRLEIAAGVTLVGQEGAVLLGNLARLVVTTEGVRFESLNFPQGLAIVNGSVTT